MGPDGRWISQAKEQCDGATKKAFQREERSPSHRAGTRRVAQSLASEVSPRSVKVMKRQFWEAPYQTLGEAIELANTEMVASVQSEDFKEGVRHFIEKRPAQFTGR